MNRDKVLDLAKKVKALADKGKDGEKSAAKDRLAKICKKYNISEDELIVLEEVKDFFLILNDPHEKDLLKNVICMVLQIKGMRWKERNNCVLLKMTTNDFSDVSQAFEHYRSVYNEYKKYLVQAIIAKNEIYCKKEDPKPSEPVSSQSTDTESKSEKLPGKPVSEKLIKIANIIEKNPWFKKRNSLTD